MAEYEVRPLGADDVDAALMVRGNAFGNPLDDAQREVVRSRFERGGSFGIDLDGRLAGMLTVYPLGQFFGGASVPMGGIGSVAVSVEFRGRGVAPALLAELKASTDPVVRKLNPVQAAGADLKKVSFDEKSFRFALNEDAMATEKTSEGIRLFSADIVKLEQLIAQKRG